MLKGGEVIELDSDLGSGKTTFVKGLAQGIGSADRVASPTFTISKIYKGPKLSLHHFDFYRLSDAGILADELKESLQNPQVITVIEWSGIVKNVLPKRRISIKLLPLAGNLQQREMSIKYPASLAETIQKFEQSLQLSKP